MLGVPTQDGVRLVIVQLLASFALACPQRVFGMVLESGALASKVDVALGFLVGSAQASGGLRDFS